MFKILLKRVIKMLLMCFRTKHAIILAFLSLLCGRCVCLVSNYICLHSAIYLRIQAIPDDVYTLDG